MLHFLDCDDLGKVISAMKIAKYMSNTFYFKEKEHLLNFTILHVHMDLAAGKFVKAIGSSQISYSVLIWIAILLD